MHIACLFSDLAPGEAVWLGNAPPIAAFEMKDG